MRHVRFYLTRVPVFILGLLLLVLLCLTGLFAMVHEMASDAVQFILNRMYDLNRWVIYGSRLKARTPPTTHVD